MTYQNLLNLVKPGILKAEPADLREFAGLLRSGKIRLADAQMTGLSPESRFDLAYNAAHALALAALRSKGFPVILFSRAWPTLWIYRPPNGVFWRFAMNAATWQSTKALSKLTSNC